jgi:hypothetical protein
MSSRPPDRDRARRADARRRRRLRLDPGRAEHALRLEGAETRWLATYAPAGPERHFAQAGAPWPYEVIPIPRTQ